MRVARGVLTFVMLETLLVTELVSTLRFRRSAMTVIRNSVVVEASCEEAFDYLSDHRAELEWNPKCVTMEKITEGPVGQGTRYLAKWKGSPRVELETVHYDRPNTWTMHNDGPIEVTFTCRLEPMPVGTTLSVEFEPRPHGWMR